MAGFYLASKSKATNRVEWVAVGKQKQLLVDDYIVTETDNVTLEVGQEKNMVLSWGRPCQPTDATQRRLPKKCRHDLVSRQNHYPKAEEENIRIIFGRKVVRPGGFEPPTSWFVAMRSIQLIYGRARRGRAPCQTSINLASGF